jgi:hypothetical protein
LISRCSKALKVLANMTYERAVAQPELATRVLYSDIDGTVVHYLETECQDGERKLVGESITMELEDEASTYRGSYKCTNHKVGSRPSK